MSFDLILQLNVLWGYNRIVKAKVVTSQPAIRNYSVDDSTYSKAKKLFHHQEFVSTASLQRILQIPYFRARYILDKMIEEGYCEKQKETWPCRIVRKTN